MNDGATIYLVSENNPSTSSRRGSTTTDPCSGAPDRGRSRRAAVRSPPADRARVVIDTHTMENTMTAVRDPQTPDGGPDRGGPRRPHLVHGPRQQDGPRDTSGVTELPSGSGAHGDRRRQAGRGTETSADAGRLPSPPAVALGPDMRTPEPLRSRALLGPRRQPAGSPSRVLRPQFGQGPPGLLSTAAPELGIAAGEAASRMATRRLAVRRASRSGHPVALTERQPATSRFFDPPNVERWSRS